VYHVDQNTILDQRPLPTMSQKLFVEVRQRLSQRRGA
jgi:hypothetical protein